MVRVSARVCILILAVTSLSPRPANAQQDRRRVVEGLLKAFIDSQLPDDRDSQNNSRSPSPPRATPSPRNTNPPNRTGRPEAQRSTSSSRSIVGDSSIREAGLLLTQASDEMARLVRSLEADIYRARGVRQLLSLAMKVNADATVLSRRLTHADSVEKLREPLRELDQDWHTLDYRLGLIQNLSQRTYGHIERIRQYETKLAQMFEVPTQIDLAAVSDLATEVYSTLRGLLDDIQYELPNSTQANRLVQQGRAPYEASVSLVRLTRNNAPYDDLTEAFGELRDNWGRYDQLLRPVNNRYVQRKVQRINEAIRKLNDLMYLQSPQVGREELMHQVAVLRRDTDSLLDQITLRMLTQIPAARTLAVSAATDFDIACSDLAEVIDAEDDFDVVEELFVYAHDEWDRLTTALQGSRSDRARQAMRDVNQSLANLQGLLGVQFDFDREKSSRLAGQLVKSAREIQGDIQNVFGQPNKKYRRNFENQGLTAAAEFTGAARKLQQSLLSGEKLRLVASECQAVRKAWEELDKLLPQFAYPEKQFLISQRRLITPQIVELQTLLAL